MNEAGDNPFGGSGAAPGPGTGETDPGTGESESGFDDSFMMEVLGKPGQPPVFQVPVPGEPLGGPNGERFEILEALGQGAMGMVFRARDEVLQRVVALKFIYPRRELSTGALQNLIQEAKLVAQLDHENIVRIFDVAEWQGAPFLVMECLEGEPLAALLKRGRLQPLPALRLLGDIASGLAHAHARQIIHRDLKPSNVFVLPDGRAKLVDFGLASLTSAGSAVLPREGTPSYMAPEQWRGEAQDARTDIWSAGVVLFQLLTGSLPYTSTGGMRKLRSLVLSPKPAPSVRAFRQDLPEELDRLLARALAKDPARRFQSALELRERLDAVAGSLASPEARRPVSSFQRRQLTLVSCSLAGRGARVDDEELSELQAGFHRACEQVFRRYGGTVMASAGERVLACFGYPQVQEEGVLCAARAGLALIREAEALSAHHQLTARVGVYTSLVVLDGHQGALSLQGEAPDIAAWLAGRAAPGAVLLSDSTLQGVRGAFETLPLGALRYEGALGSVAVEAHQLVRELPAETRFERAVVAGLTPLVGRGAEMELLHGAWQRAVAGHGAAVLLQGEAGLGKSRLVQELREQVAPEARACIAGQCWKQLSNTAFHPVVELISHLLGLSPEAPPAANLRRLKDALSAVDLAEPEYASVLAALLSPLTPPDSASSLPVSSERRKEQTLEALSALLLGEERPLFVVVEDVQWADHSTLELLGWVLERMEESRLCLLLTARPPFQPFWREHPWLHRVALERLPPRDSAALVRQVARARALPEEIVAQLVQRADGIPLFAEEMTHMLLERGASGDGAAGMESIPVTLNELLLARLEPLPGEQKELAQLAAMVGRSFTQRSLAALSGRPDAALRRELEELVDVGLLCAREGDRYEFRHALLQEAAYQSVPRARRRKLHLHIARSLSERPPEDTEARPELIAHHYTRAGEVGQAIPYWLQAGEVAIRRSAYVEAVGHLSLALRLFGSLPEAERRIDEELRLLVPLGQSLISARGFLAPEVERIFARIGELCQAVGPEDAQVLVAAAGALFTRDMQRMSLLLTCEMANQLVALGQRMRVPQLLAVGHVMCGMAHLLQGKLLAALELLEQAVEEAGPATAQGMNPGVLVLEPGVGALSYAAVATSGLCDEAGAKAFSERALRRAEALGHPYTTVMALDAAAILFQLLGDARRALELADRAIALRDAQRFPEWLGWAPLIRAWALAALGQPEEGMELLIQGIERLGHSGADGGWSYLLGLLADVYLRMGRIREGLSTVDAALSWCGRTGESVNRPELRRLQGELLRLAGEETCARGCLLEAVLSSRHAGALLQEIRAGLSLCRLLCQQGRAWEARQWLEECSSRFPPGNDSSAVREARGLLQQLRALAVVEEGAVMPAP